MLVLCIILLIWITYSISFIGMYLPSNIWYLYWILISLGTTILTVLIITLLLVLFFSVTKPTNKIKHKVMYYICSFILLVLGIDIKYVNKNKLPKNKTYVVYGNHKSMCDALIVYKLCNTTMSAAGKSTLSKVFFLPIIMKAFGVMLINRSSDRETAKSMIEGINNVKNGLSMMIFPEGGIKTLDTEEMIDVKPGAYKLATKALVPIVPISIIGSSKIRQKKNFRRIKIKVIIHDPINSDVYNGLNTIELGEKVLNIINEGVRHNG